MKQLPNNELSAVTDLASPQLLSLEVKVYNDSTGS